MDDARKHQACTRGAVRVALSERACPKSFPRGLALNSSKVFRLIRLPMLILLRTSSRLSTRPWAVATSSRCLSTTAPRWKEAESAEPEAEADAKPDASPAARPSTDVFNDGFKIKRGEDPRYIAFVNGPGKQFRVADPNRPKNWLGGNRTVSRARPVCPDASCSRPYCSPSPSTPRSSRQRLSQTSCAIQSGTTI